MQNETNPLESIPAALCSHAERAVNVLTVERALIDRFSHQRIVPEYERIHYGVLEPDEVGLALALQTCRRMSTPGKLRLEFTLWGRSCRADEFRSWFRKFPGKLPKNGCRIDLPGGSRIALAELSAPLGTLFEPERLLGIPVLNGIMFLSAELDLLESCFHADDAPAIGDLLVEEKRLPLLELEHSAGEYLQRRLRKPVEVELDSLSPLRRRGGAELRLRVALPGSDPAALAARFPILRPEFQNPADAPLAMLPDTVCADYFTILCIYGNP